MSNSPIINQFVGTLDEVLSFLDSYQDDLFYFDINPTNPPQGARHFKITTFSPRVARRVIDELHPGPAMPRLTPLAKQKMDEAVPLPTLDCGMNIHPKNGMGWPTIPVEFSRFKWVRFPYISSPVHFPSVEASFGFFDPVIDAYNRIGVKIILVLGHEMYGEGAGWVWPQMTPEKWRAFDPQFTAVAEKVIRRYGNRVHAYEVWNEGDVGPNNPSAVSFPPADYAPLLDSVSKLIRQHAPQSKVVLGGLVNSVSISAQYVKVVKNTLGRLPVDAIGVHPYGQGAPNDKTIFSRFGNIDAYVQTINNVAPGVPLWLTELGALGTDNPAYWDDVALYLKNMYGFLKTMADKTPVAIWYAWSDAMDMAQKTNGLVKVNGEKKQYVYDSFFNIACG